MISDRSVVRSSGGRGSRRAAGRWCFVSELVLGGPREVPGRGGGSGRSQGMSQVCLGGASVRSLRRADAVPIWPQRVDAHGKRPLLCPFCRREMSFPAAKVLQTVPAWPLVTASFSLRDVCNLSVLATRCTLLLCNQSLPAFSLSSTCGVCDVACG